MGSVDLRGWQVRVARGDKSGIWYFKEILRSKENKSPVKYFVVTETFRISILSEERGGNIL